MVQMGSVSSNLTMDFFLLEPININVSRSAGPKLSLVKASRYNLDVKLSNDNVCAKFIRIKRGSDGAHVLKLNKVLLINRETDGVHVF